MKLSEAKIKAAKPADREYKLADGHGLTLIVMPHGSKLWRFRVYRGGKENMLSLGAYPVVTLAAARERTLELRRQRHAETATSAMVLPQHAVAQAVREQLPAAVAKPAVLLGTFADEWLAGYATKQGLADGTRDELERFISYFCDKLGRDTALAELTAPGVYNAARKIAEENGESVGVRGLTVFKKIMAEAVARGDIPHNPAASVKMEAPRKANPRAGITDPAALGDLLKAIAADNGTQPVVKLGLRLLAIVYTRPMELMQAKWSEFDLDSNEPQWIIPAERMKLRREHVVPLPRQAVAILRELHKITGHTGTVFTLNGGKPINPKSFRHALERIGYKGKQDPHGFRATASTLLAEQGHDESVIELSLAHAIPGVKGIYNRSHKLPQRRELAQAWADYLEKIEG